MNQLTKKQYKALFKGKEKEALERAWQNRDFEISHYWKRATYFWTFIAVIFAGYFAFKTAVTSTENKKLELILLCLGFIFTLAWLLANLGSKKWQKNWEKHITELEDYKTGPLYKTVLNIGSYSVSKINIRVNLVVLIIWIGLGWDFLYNNYKLGFNNVDYFTTTTLGITIFLAIDMVLLSGRSGFRYIKSKNVYFRNFQTKYKMNIRIKILAALKTDSMEGWGWIQSSAINGNGFYTISKPNGKSITCYLRIIDANFLKNYEEGNTFNVEQNENLLILNEYYRKQIGIEETNNIYNLKIKKSNKFNRLFSFDFSHPNPNVRRASQMTLLSLILGLISIVLTIITLV